MKATALYADERCREHLKGRNHPERPERFDAVMDQLRRARLVERLMRLAPRPAELEELLLCHTREYLETARHDIAAGYGHLTTGDTDVTANSWEIALLGAGGVLQAVDAIAVGEARNAFCLVRPPGHHATPARGMGFCIVNNIAIGARYAQRKHGIERVVILDWDVHHGNGTQDIFYTDPTVFYFSTHQWPLYPGTGRSDETGAGAGKGFTMNFPFPAGSGRAEIFGAVERSLLPRMKEFRPNLVMISAG
ncbi:MAG: histone deacetylase, partial [Acidobacteriia bacterium]|nr:histone deacetylase [Terriglobia bacterium]